MHWLTSVTRSSIRSFIALILSASPFAQAEQHLHDAMMPRQTIFDQLVKPLANEVPLANTTKPVIVYAAIDTPESLMQLSVDFELRTFFKHCDRNHRQNWITLVNSYYTKNAGEVAYCKDGQRGNIILAKQYPELFKDIERIRTKVSDPMYTAEMLPELQFPFEITDDNTRHRYLYEAYPLANADILYRLLAWVDNEELFPKKKFSRFIHLKGHGVRSDEEHLNIVLTGLNGKSVLEKTKEQHTYWEILRRRHPKAPPFPKLIPGNVGKGDMPLADEWLHELGISKIDPARTYAQHLRLDAAAGIENGLGRRYGVGAHEFFGIDSAMLINLINDLEDVGFLFIEACHANLGINTGLRLFMAKEGIKAKGIYSPVGTLWYRNINWDEILSTDAATNNELLYQAMVAHTSRIKNYFIEEDKLR